jgi:S-adenosyl-L-methionine hydrolase (adenosine-forming)
MIITLLTDFGTADSYVAEVKGVLLGGAPGATLVDVTHDISPGDIRSAAYVLGRAWHRFPAGTVHLAVVDPGVGSARAALALSAHGHCFVGPDNGVFTPIYHDAEVEAIALPIPSEAAPTFHGRDLFAPAAAALAAGAALASLGQRFADIPERLAYTPPHAEGRSIVGEIVYVDRFGSLISNVGAEQILAHAVIEIEELEVGPLMQTYNDVAPGNLLAYIGSGGAVEIAVRDGSAAERLGVGMGSRVRAKLG